jgi:hypothetical protein
MHAIKTLPRAFIPFPDLDDETRRLQYRVQQVQRLEREIRALLSPDRIEEVRAGLRAQRNQERAR